MDLLQLECLSGLEEAEMLARHPTVQVTSYHIIFLAGLLLLLLPAEWPIVPFGC